VTEPFDPGVEQILALQEQLDRLRRLRQLKGREREQEVAEVRRYLYDPVGYIDRYILWKPGQGLTGYQEEIAASLPKKKRVAVRGPHGLGKSEHVHTLIATPTGWTTVGDLKPGDEIFDEQGKICRVVAKSPVWLDRACVVGFSDGATAIVHPEHEWDAIDVYDRPKGVRDWRDHWAATRRVTTEYMSTRLRSPGGQRRWRVPVARALELPPANLLVDPYLLGVWLGDGTSGAGQFTLNRADASEIAAHIPGGHYTPSGERSNCRTYSIYNLRAKLQEIGVLGNKHIPDVYLRASVEQRRELVRGLWDSDGYRQAGGGDEISLNNFRLAADVRQLLHTLGLVVWATQGDSVIHESGVPRKTGTRYRVAARFDFNPYRLSRYDWTPRGAQASRHTQRTIVDIRRIADQPTQCIEVDSPSRLYLSGESLIPTHNSALSATIVLWFANTREAAGIDWKVLTTASAWRHLTKYLWPEIHKFANQMNWDELGRPEYSDRSELLDLTLKLRHGAASAVASSKPEYIEGAHADSLLYLIDEAKIVPDEAWDAIEGALSGGRPDGLPEAFVLAVSTPGPPRGRFYDIHRRAPGFEDWHVRHVKLEEAVAAGRISKEWAAQRALQWGEDSALYANRVLGNFHEEDEDGLIPLSWVEAAIERWNAWDDAGRPELEGRQAVGVDVARAGTDRTIFAHRTGPCITDLVEHPRQDTMKTTAKLIPLVSQGVKPGRDGEGGEPKVVGVVDSIGVGGGVVDRMRELKLPVLAYTGSAKTDFRDRTKEYLFNHTRSAAYWHLRELLDPTYGSELMLPPDDLLISDLTTPTWTIATGVPPRIVVEKKEDVVQRLGRSPDRGDAVVMAYWAEQLRREGEISRPVQTRLPVRPISPLSGRSTGAGGRTGMGPLG
jgi:hypothetical protein